MLFVDDKIPPAKSEDDLQCSVYNLNNATAEFSTERNTEKKKKKIMTFRLRNQSEARSALMMGY